MTDSVMLSGAPLDQRSDKWWHLTFGGMLAVALIFFITWSMGYVGPDANKAMLITTIAFGVFMAFNIGGNDVANSFGTSVGAGTLSMKQALVIAAIFEVSGAVLAGGEVTDTVKSGIVDLGAIDLDPQHFAFIMMASLLGAAVWLLVATKMGWPVSTTHSIVGGIVGASLLLGFTQGIGGWEMVQWAEIGRIAMSWVLSPLLGGLCAWLLFGFIKKHILVYNEEADEALRQIKADRIELHQSFKASFERLNEIQQLAYTNAMTRDAALIQEPDFDPEQLESDYYRNLYRINTRRDSLNTHRALENWVPLLAAAGAVLIGAMMLFKGLKNLNLHISNLGNVVILVMLSVVVWMAISIFSRLLRQQELTRATFVLFSWMQVFTASAFAFSHGSNDIANAIGPFSAVLDVLRTDSINGKAAVPTALMVTCGISLIAGLWFIGRYVIHTVGTGLTKMHPASGFAAELSAAAVVMGASVIGLPVSSTHILIGAILGIGVVNKSANWRLMKPIGMAWIITLPAAAAVSGAAVLLLNAVWG
ncbi:inorganic phosphate transporter [Corynebacterium belfantii]|uniref:Phosphate transporter n=1 Tax=Corynebacterium belfantii TaxID=2014537 RepID=A0ABS0LDH4_9CORY|nr:inorganic phosphate transporter [Corynebacterium belfantii]OLN15727.1 phosphate permease [Corynebacterium diphtheriae] [Corynebacterium diphtheriae subsp. lausannense]QVI99889.1 inorganic phosphate transporter [Corynebacterium diphtheriae]MBG9244838.1 inorganic phosphate transporter [Corynebacterium belfantii]MBG9260239.1 inorganic phosphate transporter [Corynebacterium belfantii]MBG9265157.1 inorganic phosphate transporter [Corynebacterium belfantii]